MDNIAIDQRGTYLVLSTFGILMVCRYTQGAISPRQVARRIVTFPPLIALLNVGILDLRGPPGRRLHRPDPVWPQPPVHLPHGRRRRRPLLRVAPALVAHLRGMVVRDTMA